MSYMTGKTWQEHRTHCKQGHEYTPQNTYVMPSNGWRFCMTCRREDQARRRARNHPIKFMSKGEQLSIEIARPSPGDHKKRRNGRARAFLDALKSAPCTDCSGSFHSCAMDFDHLDDDAPKRSISKMMAKGTSLEAIAEEIAKCELVCSNCHRVRTMRRARAKASGTHVTTPAYKAPRPTRPTSWQASDSFRPISPKT